MNICNGNITRGKEGRKGAGEGERERLKTVMIENFLI
jgi:hypothetical protein